MLWRNVRRAGSCCLDCLEVRQNDLVSQLLCDRGGRTHRAPGRRNAERHITKWRISRPSGTTALHAFRVRVPETELRMIPLGEDLASVHWLPAPPSGNTVSLECYITPPSSMDPVVDAALPHSHLFSLPLADSRWMVVLHHNESLEGRDLDKAREAIRAQVRVAGIELLPEHRACAFTESAGTARGLIELCPAT